MLRAPTHALAAARAGEWGVAVWAAARLQLCNAAQHSAVFFKGKVRASATPSVCTASPTPSDPAIGPYRITSTLDLHVQQAARVGSVWPVVRGL
jgi:hypothetical protein